MTVCCVSVVKSLILYCSCNVGVEVSSVWRGLELWSYCCFLAHVTLVLKEVRFGRNCQSRSVVSNANIFDGKVNYFYFKGF